MCGLLKVTENPLKGFTAVQVMRMEVCHPIFQEPEIKSESLYRSEPIPRIPIDKHNAKCRFCRFIVLYAGDSVPSLPRNFAHAEIEDLSFSFNHPCLNPSGRVPNGFVV